MTLIQGAFQTVVFMVAISLYAVAFWDPDNDFAGGVVLLLMTFAFMGGLITATFSERRRDR